MPKNLKLKGNPIEYVKETKYLGVYLDSKLTWKNHVNHCPLQAGQQGWDPQSNAVNLEASLNSFNS